MATATSFAGVQSSGLEGGQAGCVTAVTGIVAGVAHVATPTDGATQHFDSAMASRSEAKRRTSKATWTGAGLEPDRSSTDDVTSPHKTCQVRGTGRCDKSSGDWRETSPAVCTIRFSVGAGAKQQQSVTTAGNQNKMNSTSQPCWKASDRAQGREWSLRDEISREAVANQPSPPMPSQDTNPKLRWSLKLLTFL